MMETVVVFVHHVISSKLSRVPDMKKLKCIPRMEEDVKHNENTLSSSLNSSSGLYPVSFISSAFSATWKGTSPRTLCLLDFLLIQKSRENSVSFFLNVHYCPREGQSGQEPRKFKPNNPTFQGDSANTALTNE